MEYLKWYGEHKIQSNSIIPDRLDTANHLNSLENDEANTTGIVMSPTNDSRSRVQMRDQIMAGENGEVYIYETDEANSVYAQQSRPPVLEMGNCGRKEPEPTGC